MFSTRGEQSAVHVYEEMLWEMRMFWRFKKLDMLPFYSQYIFSLLIFGFDNISHFKTSSELYYINTRNKNNFHLSQSIEMMFTIWVLKHLITYLLT
jgi:hypothetical protein